MGCNEHGGYSAADNMEHFDERRIEMMYKIVRVAGCVEHLVMDELPYKDALEWCEYFGWEWSEEPGAFVWDLEIREM